MFRSLFFLLVLCLLFNSKTDAQVTVSGAVTGNGGYSTLAAAFTAIGTSQSGANIIVTITGNTTETTTTTIGIGNWSTVTIRPSGGSFSISGAITAGSPLIDFNGADNVTINGDDAGTAGSINLTITNTTASATSGTSTLRFLGGATNNTVTNCSVQGSFNATSIATNGGVIFFSTDANTTAGNDNNTISNCNLGPAGTNLPVKVIYGNGSTSTTAIGNSGIIIDNNNFFDFFHASAASAGIYTNSGCNTWSITNNRFYQTATRTWTTGALHTPININGTTTTQGAQGFTITGNTIGYASSTQTGTYTLTGSTGSFMGIRFNGISGATVSNINSNTIAAVSLTGVTSSGTGTSSPFAAIMIPNGNVITNSNTIGSQSATGSLVYSTTNTGSNDVYGMYNFGVDSWTASSNNIGGISFTNAAGSGSHIFYGLRANTGTGVTFTANSNNIGGTVANSIQLSVTGTGSEVIGIFTSNANASFTGNTIRNLTTSAGTGTAVAAGAMGICVNSTTASNPHTVSTNTIYNLTNSFAGAATINGIFFAGPSLANIVERNFIYDLNAANTSAIVNGIYLNNGTTTYKNNMIRLGTSGSTATVGMTIYGVYEIGGTDNFYNNSIYVGGAPTGGTSNTFAFWSSVTATRAYQNNIFWNARSNSGSSGKHYAISAGGTANPATGLTSSYNDLYVTGTGGYIGLYNTVDRLDIAAWRSATTNDVTGSFSSNPQFIDPTGTTPDLHIHATNATSVEAGGLAIGSVTDDFDGQTRSGLSPTDIGADAGNFTGQDIAAPIISYTAITTTCGFGNITLSGVTITDATGVPTSGGLMPRVYYRKGAGSWFSQPGTLSSGSGTNGTWSFTMLASDMGGLATGNTVSYYVIAQDAVTPTPNLTSNPSAGLAASNVNTVTTHPTTPSSLTVKPTLGGVYTVGVGGNYTTLTAAVMDYNAACLTDSVTFSLIDNTYAGETYPITINLNSYATSTFKLIIKPAATKTPAFSGTIGNPLFDLNGAKYVTIDGSNTVGGTTKDLTITNNNTSNATIRLINDATNNLIKNSVIQGSSNSSTSVGVIFFSTAAGLTTGNDNNTVSNCDITNGASTPANAIYSLGTTSTTALYNSNNTITGCNISNYFSTLASYGVFLSLGSTDWIVSNNKLFQTAQRSFTTAVAHRPIYINSNTAGNNFSITGNTIGFANASGTGTYDLTTASSSFTFTGIYINAASTTATSIQGNTISGISVNTASSGTTTSSPCSGIIIANGLVNVGNGTANTIGSLSGASGIDFTTSSTLATSVYAVLNFGSDITNISNNNIGKITTNATGGGLVLYGVHVFVGTAQTATVNNNTIGSSSAPLTNNATGTGARVLGISCTNTIAVFTNNQISYLTTAAPNTSTGLSASVIGILIDSSPNSPMTVSGNRIFALSNTNGSSAVIVSGIALYTGSQGGAISGNFIHSSSVANASAIIYGIDLPSTSTSNATFSNNMIRLGVDASGSGVNVGCVVNGVNETGTGHVSNFYFNSIYIGGAPTGGSANTFALRSTVTSNTRRYQNNILFNARSNNGSTGKHYAMQVGGTTANPSGLTTNYNDLVANGAGGLIGLFNSVDRADITAWKTATGQDANSFTYDPQYIAPTGNAATVDLHIQASPNPTPIEARGLNIATVTLDYDGQARASFTPEDIGADADNFTQAPLTPNCAGTLAPATGTNQSTTVSLSWGAVSGVTGYDVYWSTNQTDVTNEAGAALVSSNQAGTSYVTAGSINNTYYWKVVSRNVAGTSPSCTVMNYNTTVPNCATLTAPANAATNVCAVTGNLTWTAPGSGTAPTGYKLYFGTDGGGVTTPTNVVNGTNLGNVLTYGFSSLAGNATYYWQIIPTAASGDASGCAIRSFTTGAATIETQTPVTDDFEYCQEWTLVNPTTNKWVIGTATHNGGSKSIYISNDNGVSNVYSVGTSQTAHFYRDVLFPAGETIYSFTFDMRGSGENNYDRLLVFIAPTTVTPVINSPVSNNTPSSLVISGATLVYQQTAFQTSYAQISVPLTSTQVGNTSANSTRRIIFTWQNDGNTGTQPPAAIDNISITSSAPAPLTYSSSTVIQPVTSSVVANTQDNQVVGVRVNVSGSSGTLNATSITLSTQGTATTADIANAKLWWTGSSSSFAATTQVGSTIASPSGAMVFNFTQALATGDNYFWLSYDIQSGATAGRTIDAVGITNGITVGGNTYTPSTLDPAGSRQILVPLCGTTYTINNTLPTAGLNYNSFTDAINDLNAVGTGCAVVFNVKDGQTFNETTPIITATGTAVKTITFQRDNSTGTRPTLQGTTGTSAADAVIQINSGDYFTFDGINIKDNPANGNAVAKMEYGVYLLGSTGNGCRHNTVKNSTITMNYASGSSNANTRGVFISSAPTSTGGTCNYNSFYNNTVENAVNGYLFNNSTAIYDTLNQVGIISGGSSTIQNIGLGANVTAYGVGTEGQFNFKLSDTKINNVTSADLAFGFYNATIRSSVTINGCRITNVNGNEADNIAAVRVSNTNSTILAYDDTIHTISNTLAASSSAAHAFYLNSGKKKVYNCIIGGSAATEISSLSGDASAFYIIGGTSGVMDSIYNNTASYIEGGSANSTNTGYGIRSTHNSSYFAGNNFSNISGLYNAYGIAVSDISDIRIFDNVISTLATSATNNSAVGINATTANNGTVRIYRNKVSGVTAGTASTGATAYGIQVNPSNGTVTAEVVNNMVSDIRANNANSGTTCSVAGIRFGPNGGSSTGRFYFNTVYLNGTGTNSALQTAAFASNTNSNVASIELISNIFYNLYNVNTGANAAAIWATGSLATYAGKLTAASNNNFLYAGTPGTKHYIFSGTTGTTDLTTALSAYKTGVGGSKESASLTGTLNFANVAGPYDLHISPTTTSCTINGAGKAVSGITSDIDNDVRCDASCVGSNIPDIGADEFDCILVWTGNVSTAWDNPLNWTPNVVPDQTINVLIPDVSAGSNRYPVLVGTPTTFETKDITIDPGASVTLSFSTTAGVPQADLTVYGAFVNNGAADMGYGSLAIKTGSSISGAITTGYLKIDGNVSLNAGAIVQVKRELTLKSGTFNVTAGSLTLKSDAASTGYVNDFGSNNGSLSGNLTIERYIPSGAVNDFHYIGSATGGTAGIWSDDFANAATTTSDNVPVTPKGDCDPLNLAVNSAYGSLFSYDQSLVTTCYLSGWRVRTTGAAAARGRGFAAKIATGVILDEAGAYNKTNVTLSGLAISASNTLGSSRGFHMVANPFFAPVDWNAMAALPANSNMDGTAYIYDPNSGTYGAYNMINSGTIPTNLGFFVRGLTGASFNVTFDASTRIAGTNSNFLRQSQPYEYGLKIKAISGARSDETFIAFDKNFTDGYDNGYDAGKLLSSYGVPSLYTKDATQERKAIEALGINTDIKSIPLGMLVTGAGGNYTFTFEGVEDFPATTIIWLEDLKTGTIQYLRQSQTYSFTASETDNPDRFVLHFSPELLVSSTGAECSGSNGTITLEQRGGIEWSLRLTDSNNNVIESDVFTATDVVDHLVPGIYTLKLTHAVSGYATQLTVNVTGLQTVTAGVIASATQVLVNESITVEAQTTGATNYTWTMGDGTTITGQQTINYSYAHEGTYEVTLFAANDACNATTKISITVSKQDTVNTGIPIVEEGALTAYENNDVLFVTQTISKKATATVTIYNALGQIVLPDDVKELSYKASYQLPVHAAAGVYYAHIQLNSGERKTLKMMLGEQ